MHLFSHILTVHVQHGTQVLLKKQQQQQQNKIQIMENKCIQFALDWRKCIISLMEFRSITWFPTSKRVHQCINAITFKFVNNNDPLYLNEIFEFHPYCRIDTRNSFARLQDPFCKTNMGQKNPIVHWSLFVEQST